MPSGHGSSSLPVRTTKPRLRGFSVSGLFSFLCAFSGFPLMNFALLVIGKTEEPWLLQGIEVYTSRLRHYANFELVVIPSLKAGKSLPEPVLKQKEGEQILARLQPSDHVVLLDDKGKQFSSTELAANVQAQLNAGYKRVVFVVGGAFGFSPDVYARANARLSLSRMTFSHQMIRVLFVEQLYRAFTILKGEKYHHE